MRHHRGNNETWLRKNETCKIMNEKCLEKYDIGLEIVGPWFHKAFEVSNNIIL